MHRRALLGYLCPVDMRYPIAGLAVLATLGGWRIAQVQTPEAVEPPVQLDAPATDAAVQSTPETESTLRFAPHSLEVASAARRLLERPDYGYRDDCSGWVSSVYSEAGIPMDGTVAELYALAQERGTLHHHPIPRIGDLVFFDNTHDRNDNGIWDDPRTHIAVVVDVEPDGTAVLAHRGSDHRLLRMNLLHPMTHDDADGNELNGHLRRYGRSDTWSLYLASQLWTAFATVDPERPWLGPSATQR